mgnify:CR=1 FL=1
MNKFILLPLFATLFITNFSQACSVMAGYELPMKNDIIVTIANKYNADMINSTITLNNYSHRFLWKFSDPGFDCHDTDIFDITMTMTYPDPWDSSLKCEAKVTVYQTSGPKVKEGPYIIERNISEIHNTCEQ